MIILSKKKTKTDAFLTSAIFVFVLNSTAAFALHKKKRKMNGLSHRGVVCGVGVPEKLYETKGSLAGKMVDKPGALS